MKNELYRSVRIIAVDPDAFRNQWSHCSELGVGIPPHSGLLSIRSNAPQVGNQDGDQFNRDIKSDSLVIRVNTNRGVGPIRAKVVSSNSPSKSRWLHAIVSSCSYRGVMSGTGWRAIAGRYRNHSRVSEEAYSQCPSLNAVNQLRCHERPKSEYQCDRNEADHHKDASEATATFTRKEHDVHSANNGEDQQKRHSTPGAYEPILGAAATTSPSTESPDGEP
ncbi:hypothetical protein [Neorhizobium sp. T7_12]|jgi:hypothetical protein|uniref:hypothetical protein n=1 Tax=Neorhizobium sp. T7_12 TaxID=2093832 RepID=UPI00155E65E6|nr:hypothetical protein [Neorhizobium sp. T7_12]